MKKKLFLSFLMLLVIIINSCEKEDSSSSKVILDNSFESGLGNWSVDNGVWEIGTPTVGPDKCFSGNNCAGTVMDSDYPANSNTRLISPPITLPDLDSGEKLRLKFWNWFLLNESVHGNDQGWVQVSVDGGEWENVFGPFSGISPVWTQVYVDLSSFAGSNIRIAFYLISNVFYNATGWFLDDVSIVKGKEAFLNPCDFESGVGDWSADNGLWEIGTPSVGPTSCHSGNYCAGTMLNSDYPENSDTRLISPEFKVTSSSTSLFFWHWFRLNESVHGNDQGWIQISSDGGDWQNVFGPFSGTSSVWTQVSVDLSQFENTSIRIAFYLVSNVFYNDNGWYIDDIRIED